MVEKGLNVIRIIKDQYSYEKLIESLIKDGNVIEENWKDNKSVLANRGTLYVSTKNGNVIIRESINEILHGGMESLSISDYEINDSCYVMLNLDNSVFSELYLAFDKYTEKYLFVNNHEINNDRLITIHDMRIIEKMQDESNLDFVIILMNWQVPISQES